MSRRLHNVGRKIVGRNSNNVLNDEINSVRTRGETPFQQQAVVVDVIYDPVILTDDDKDKIASTVNNHELVDVMPINTIIGKIISHEQGTIAKNNTIIFPYFSSHFLLPIKPGEVVHLVYEDYSGTGSKLAYWLSKVHSPYTIEDVNYTHRDRIFDPTMNPINYRTGDKAERSSDQPGPNFQNGGNTPETFTITPSGSMDKPYETIIKNAKSYSLITPEPVPRWKKRPQEFVIQGSNNSLIMLGEDRAAAPENEEDSKGFSGTIDMVVGRSRNLSLDQQDAAEETNPLTTENARGTKETDKAPYRRNATPNPNEGNPNYQTDAARIYVTQQSEADVRFNLSTRSYPSDTLKPEQPNEGSQSRWNKSYVVEKADHLRMVARKDEQNGINGTALIIKEGESDSDLAYIFIDEKGQIQIEGSKIYLGKATNESEPYIKWTEFDKTVKDLQAQIDALQQYASDLTNALNSAFSSAVGNLGAPIPTLAAAFTPVTTPKLVKTQTTITQKKQAVSQAVEASKSEKVYGE